MSTTTTHITPLQELVVRLRSHAKAMSLILAAYLSVISRADRLDAEARDAARFVLEIQH